MTDPNKKAADQIIDQLPPYVRRRLLEIARVHGKNRHAMRASRTIISRALAEKDMEEARRARQRVTRAAASIRCAFRMRARELRGNTNPLPGMTEERRVFVLGLLTGETVIPGVTINLIGKQ